MSTDPMVKGVVFDLVVRALEDERATTAALRAKVRELEASNARRGRALAGDDGGLIEWKKAS